LKEIQIRKLITAEENFRLLYLVLIYQNKHKKEFPSAIFSYREMEVLKCLSECMEGKEIADKLNISEHTVISHRKRMLRKQRVKNTAGHVHFAVNRGII